MEVCGGHTHVIMKYGIRDVLPSNIKLISGPGCPVCVTSQRDIDSVIELSLNGVKIACYGDMIRVPGTKMSLRDAISKGADIQIVYSTDDIEQDRIFFAIGFETTTPMTAACLERGIKVFSSHKLIPPAMNAIKNDMKIDGFIDPGHVSTITGSDVWNQLNTPQVICGFTPGMMIKAVHDLVLLIKNKQSIVKNNYEQVVTKDGNQTARAVVNRNMKVVDSEWRGLGIIPQSGLDPRDDALNARIIYKHLLENIKSTENPSCRCSEVIRGLIEPTDCPLFGKTCTPTDPKGACMVSKTEGACAICYQYRGSQ